MTEEEAVDLTETAREWSDSYMDGTHVGDLQALLQRIRDAARAEAQARIAELEHQNAQMLDYGLRPEKLAQAEKALQAARYEVERLKLQIECDLRDPAHLNCRVPIRKAAEVGKLKSALQAAQEEIGRKDEALRQLANALADRCYRWCHRQPKADRPHEQDCWMARLRVIAADAFCAPRAALSAPQAAPEEQEKERGREAGLLLTAIACAARPLGAVHVTTLAYHAHSRPEYVVIQEPATLSIAVLATCEHSPVQGKEPAISDHEFLSAWPNLDGISRDLSVYGTDPCAVAGCKATRERHTKQPEPTKEGQ